MVMADLPAYSGPDIECPKCQVKKISTIWHPASAWPVKTSRDVYWECTRITGIRQHLCRECKNCGYTWAEACMDNRSADQRRLRSTGSAERTDR
jgi:hypothetical protein